MDADLFTSDNSVGWELQAHFQSQTSNMAAPLPPPLQPHNAFAADAHTGATVLRDILAGCLAQWQNLETRLRNARREVPVYCRSVFERSLNVMGQFDNLSAHDVTELQIFCNRFRSLQRDMDAVLPMMTAECDIAPSATQPALIASAHISAANSADPPMPPLPAFPPPVVVAPPNQAPQNDGAASHVTSPTRELTTESSVDSIHALLHTAKEDLKSFGGKKPERY